MDAITAEIITGILPARRRGKAIKTESAADRGKIVLTVKTEAISKTVRALTTAEGKIKVGSVSDKADSVQAAHRVQSPR